MNMWDNICGSAKCSNYNDIKFLHTYTLKHGGPGYYWVTTGIIFTQFCLNIYHSSILELFGHNQHDNHEDNNLN